MFLKITTYTFFFLEFIKPLCLFFFFLLGLIQSDKRFTKGFKTLTVYNTNFTTFSHRVQKINRPKFSEHLVTLQLTTGMTIFLQK